ncbi:helix-turn-helix domain-containing protein [Streptomyces cinerochromogenes]|uniref:helix-turn-helix domain-containing protein n=1 Tax=Streptomyces cinerochromogenes TaxID=66422 RepID=UPI0016716C82|nr:helix-turn-helix transcriptional regulator [Streptomyces cinerochromogenes]GGT02658.1 hypothetical protein GCM10010206_76590 [Streptomyces cinerochromogenes]
MTRVPADTPERPFARLADHLTALRRAARLPQRALAQAASISRGAVQRAESGTAAPTPAVLDAYVRACRGGPDDFARARLLRTRGRTAQRDRMRHLNAPHPALIRTADDLGAALAAAYENAGAPPLRNLARVPLATASRIVNRKSLPASVWQMQAFLTACRVRRPAQQRPYIDAYLRITDSLGARPTPPRSLRTPLGIHPDPWARDDTTALTSGLRAIAIGLDLMKVRREKLTPGIEVALNMLARSLGREAHRNGRSLPAYLAAGLEDVAAVLPELLPFHDRHRIQVRHLRHGQDHAEQPSTLPPTTAPPTTAPPSI